MSTENTTYNITAPAIRITERAHGGAEVEMKFATIEAYEAYVRINDLQEQEATRTTEPSAEEATAKSHAIRHGYAEESEAARIRYAKERELEGQTFRQAIKSFELDQRRVVEGWLKEAVNHYMVDPSSKN